MASTMAVDAQARASSRTTTAACSHVVTEAAELAGHHRAEQAGLAQRVDALAREAAVAVDRGGVRRQVVGGDPAGQVAQVGEVAQVGGASDSGGAGVGRGAPGVGGDQVEGLVDVVGEVGHDACPAPREVTAAVIASIVANVDLVRSLWGNSMSHSSSRASMTVTEAWEVIPAA